ncbi:hypothetical protein PsorP6_016333 [Peronosclerospora sorghi]|uniref:Uncharacterized protein n=1 Tax=Peronosclerospora sorghi TaxID=230839 RepID=A0ACC0VMJ9_9STRA|nr:hypothetical protein PsorP6_016333 [Peronosclerospora sorghi]
MTSSSESPEVLARLNAAIMGDRNPRGIPSAVFVDAVDSFMATCGLHHVEPLVGALQQMYSKYKFMETSLQTNRDTFRRKIPDTQKDLDMVRHLIQKREDGETLKTQFNLADNVYAKAAVDCSVGKVCIWLGAQVMVEYSYEEAEALLEKNVAQATEKLAQIEEDLSFLRDSIITTEVNIARIFNYDVRRRRQEKDGKLVAELEAK